MRLELSLGSPSAMNWANVIILCLSFEQVLSASLLGVDPLEDTDQHVDITYVADAGFIGAVCLDGSAPAYHLQQGVSRSWHISLEGGGWCQSEEACANRASSMYGSSKYMKPSAKFDGLLSNSVDINPDFFNWTHVLVRYCDGASFSADVNETLTTSFGKVLYFRGKRILEAVIEDLKSKGLNQASQVLLSGCSAGGLAAIHRCNHMATLLGPEVKLKCLSDGGFFVNDSDIKGNFSLLNFYTNIFSFHKLYNTLDPTCQTESKDNGTECFFPEAMTSYVKYPLFILNAAYDVWQLEHVKKLPWKDYKPCVDHVSCPPIAILQQLRTSMIYALQDALAAKRGVFVDSCFTHCHTRSGKRWNIPKIDGKSPCQAVGDWYFDRGGEVKQDIDCAYPCNLSCVPLFD